MDISDAPELALLAMYAEGMHRKSDTGAKLLAPVPDPRLIADYDLRALLIANDSIFSTPMLQVGPEPLYYGYVAVSKRDPSSWIVGVRGTAGIVEWIIDGQFFPDDVRGGTIKVEHGFSSIYGTMQLRALDGQKTLDRDAAAGIAALLGANDKITIVGHSLGSALGTYLAYDLARLIGDRVSACLFASPRTGNRAWVDAVNAALGDRYLVINYLLDLVPQLPTEGPDYSSALRSYTIKTGSAEAGIKVDPLCNHHVLSCAAMLAWTTYMKHAPALLDVDAPERACIIGNRSTVPALAKIIELAIEAGGALGLSAGDALRGLIKFRIEPKAP
ncbi:lipase family protein [Methylobacterium nigriterrae]|uniref:lipase family protein n=1 Tax=Methylobacterium nigriterrae TaxID=3127512 RepID=UPI003013FC48